MPALHYLDRCLGQVVWVPESGGDVQPEVWTPFYDILSEAYVLRVRESSNVTAQNTS